MMLSVHAKLHLLTHLVGVLVTSLCLLIFTFASVSCVSSNIERGPNSSSGGVEQLQLHLRPQGIG